jgi:hypothetical protein
MPLAVLAIALVPMPAPAEATDDAAKGAGFAVSRHVIAGGGGTSTGGAFTLRGTLGQADADPLQPSSGGSLTLAGGFWPGIAAGTPVADPVFVDGFED